MSAVDKSATDFAPYHMAARWWNDDYASMQRTVELYRDDTHQPPALVAEHGRITITFRIADGRAIVINGKYDPYIKP